MTDTIIIKGDLHRWGADVLNLASVCEANVEQGWVLMNSGHTYNIPPEVLACWFGGGTVDWKKLHEKGALA